MCKLRVCYTHNSQKRLFDKNSPIKDNPRIVDKGPCTNLSFIRRFHCTSVLVLMVKGLFSSLKFPYAQFPCSAVTGGDLYSILWEAVGRLELMEFRVLGVMCDGLAANRKLYRLHSTGTGLVFKTQNPYAPDQRPLFFFSDPPHLVKTVRNAWASPTRRLWVSNTHSA